MRSNPESNKFDIEASANAELFHFLRDPVLVVDEHNCLVGMNPAATELLKITPSSIGGTDIRESLESFPKLAAAIESSAFLEIDVGSYWGVKHFRTEISSIKGQKDRVIGKVIIMRDITKQTRLEREINRRTKAP